LTDDNGYFGKSDEKWDWEHFKNTKGYPISPNLIDWLIGQDHALTECKLCVDEWMNKLGWLKEKQWWKPFELVNEPKTYYLKIRGHKIKLWTSMRKSFKFNDKPQPKDYLPAGPFLLLLGDAGTGKSLLGRAMAGYMTEMYKAQGIKLYDVLTWANRVIPSQPRISIHPSPKGQDVVKKEHTKEARKGAGLRFLFNGIVTIMLAFGGFILGYIGGYSGLWTWIQNFHVYSMFGQDLGPVQTYYSSFIDFIINGVILPNLSLIMMGIMALSMGGMLFIFMKMFGFMGGKGSKGIGGAQNTKAPKLLIDNSSGIAPFVDATGHGSSQLFGSIAWDPYQTGDLGTPEHQRVTAGDVHRAHLGVLYIDEIKNLTGAEAVTLLTVLEDGQIPVALRSQYHGGDTAAMAVATEPIPCMVFLIAAGNMDSIPHIHPALMDRISGYGKVVYMNNRIPNTVENRRKYVQFMTQEIKRFNLLPFSRDACIAIIEEARRKSGRQDRLTCYFRQMISIIKTASTLASNDRVKEVTKEHVRIALCEHCKTIQKQVLERSVEETKPYVILDPESEPKIGQIHGLAVTQFHEEDSEMIGSVLPIRASIVKKKASKTPMPDFTVTGVNETEGSWAQNSIQKVRHVFMQMYGKDPAIDFITHIDFAQEIGVDGPSAGVAMTLALISAFTKRRIIQNVAVTGEINIKTGSKVLVTPIGGTHAKIMAAQTWGFKKVCVPQVNYDTDVKPSDYTIKVVPCKTLDDYIRECFEDVPAQQKSKRN
jgi:Lon-like ATP-dependent protease